MIDEITFVGPRMDDYHEFCGSHEADIEEWHCYWSLIYFYITKGWLVMPASTLSTIITRAGAGLFTFRGRGNDLTIKAQVLPTFNPVTKFFEELRTNYQGVKIEKLHTLEGVSTPTP
jgi:hypothetical protein